MAELAGLIPLLWANKDRETSRWRSALCSHELGHRILCEVP